MGSFVIVVFEPFVEILPKFFNASVKFLPQDDAEELFFDRSVEVFRKAAGFRRGDTRFTMLNTV